MIETFLRQIEQHPYPLIGCQSLHRLCYFFKGFQFGSESAGKKINLPYYGFQAWIERRYQVFDTDTPWASIIQLYALDDNEAFTVFFPLHRQYSTSFTDTQIQSQVQTTVVKPFHLYKLFKSIKENPTVILGTFKIDDFKCFIEGIISARKHFDIEPTAEELAYEKFPTWLFQTHHLEPTFPWERIYTFYQKTNHLDAFFIDYHAYLKTVG